VLTCVSLNVRTLVGGEHPTRAARVGLDVHHLRTNEAQVIAIRSKRKQKNVSSLIIIWPDSFVLRIETLRAR
jgi:hypothetical protein